MSTRLPARLRAAARRAALWIHAAGAAAGVATAVAAALAATALAAAVQLHEVAPGLAARCTLAATWCGVLGATLAAAGRALGTVERVVVAAAADAETARILEAVGLPTVGLPTVGLPTVGLPAVGLPARSAAGPVLPIPHGPVGVDFSAAGPRDPRPVPGVAEAHRPLGADELPQYARDAAGRMAP